MLRCDDYYLPATLDEAFDLIERFPGEHRIIAGGTDLLPWAREGRAGDVHIPVLIDISRVAEMRGQKAQDGRIRLGANTTFAEFLKDPFLKRHLPVMAHAAIWFADDQLRAAATLAGNLVNGSPAGDGIPPMVAMEGSVVLESRKDGKRHTRTVPVADFIQGPGKTLLEPGELMTAIECDDMEGWGSAFEKVGHRRSLVISTCCVAALVKVDWATRRFADVRLAIGAVGPVPCRAKELEQSLIGQPVTAETIRSLSDRTAGFVRSRSRQEYRRKVLASFVERALGDALDELGIAPVSQPVHGEERLHA
ncbi:xanthine dehydrogenase family protein subunit M [Telmatospirillum sp. J64-1]|uniref:FAD binding domain-containing protein n=1 Tax=Telmatospirillum sp. J64-1 TaxID=2502183 RepID=UPI00115E237F|nr:FAD binding domain-containing protein [Telmatospirillum sp. J64-1]